MVALKLREWAGTLPGREQLAAEKFAEALESIPLTLARNAGMDVIDAQVRLRTKSSSAQKPKFGIDVENGQIADMTSRRIYEPLMVKKNVLNAATETASMILRIDNVIAASNSKNTPNPDGMPPQGGMPSGMGDF
jgi:chaperonin GroEL (HSP60 family)